MDYVLLGNDLTTWMIAIGIAMSAGIFASGWLIDRFTRRSKRAYALLPAISLALAIPFYLAFVWAPTWPLALAAGGQRGGLPRTEGEAPEADHTRCGRHARGPRGRLARLWLLKGRGHSGDRAASRAAHRACRIPRRQADAPDLRLGGL